MAEKKVVLKNTYTSAKHYNIALFAQRTRECSAEEEQLVVDYKGKIITVTNTLRKQGRFDEFKDRMYSENNNINLFLDNKKSYEDLKKEYEDFIDSVASMTHTKVRGKTPLEKVLSITDKLSDKEFKDLLKSLCTRLSDSTKIIKVIGE